MKFRYPLNFNGITMDYNAIVPPYYSKNNPHKGIDLGWHDYQGEPVYSIGNGIVIDVGYNDIVGNYCRIQHDNNYVSRYLHLKSTAIVKKGQTVEIGQHIGYMGNTGDSNGTHLHLDIKLNDVYIDPKQICYLYDDQKCSSVDKYKIKTIDKYPDLLIVNSNVGLWMLDKNGKSIEVYPDKTIVKYIDYGYYRNGYNYYKILICENNEIGYMASEYLETYSIFEIPQKPPLNEEKKENSTSIPTDEEISQKNDENNEIINIDKQEEEETSYKLISLFEILIDLLKNIIDSIKTRFFKK